MMLPIANAILKSLFGHRESHKDLSWESEETAGESVGRDWEQLHQGGRVGGDDQAVPGKAEGMHLLSTYYVPSSIMRVTED